MPKFRKKPVEIEAVQYKGEENVDEVLKFTGDQAWKYTTLTGKFNGLGIGTMEGELTASPDDWIIKGVKNEFYPCKPDIFDMTYEPI